MARMEWKDDFSVGIVSIDNHHRKLVDYINELHDAIATDKTQEVLGTIIGNIISYTVHHFSYEEELFDKYSYEDTVAHKAKHKELIKDTLALEEQFKFGKVEISIQILNFLTDWLNKHILDTDKQYSQFLKSKGVK
jgi:hemerythrin-like metal-binding protein